MAIHSVESGGAAPFLVMQFVAGESLQARIDRQGPLELKELLRIAHQTAAGLAAAHAQGLVHRDVKPSNILLEQGIERALLTDFGLARAADDASLTHTGFLPGTPHYMSPEQVRGEPLDGRSDLFSLGSVMYAMCTGRPPFRADTSFGVLRRITDTQPRAIRELNPDIPAWLAALIDTLLAKQPAERFGSAADVAQLLEQCLAHVQQPTAVPLPRGAGILACRRRGVNGKPNSGGYGYKLLLAIAAGAGLLVATPAAIYFSNQKPRSDRAGGSGSGVSSSAPATPSDLSPSELDWDATTSEIESLSTDSAVLEERAKRLWDYPATDPTSETMP